MGANSFIFDSREATRVIDYVKEERDSFLDAYYSAVEDGNLELKKALLAMWKLGVEHGEREFSEIHLPLCWEQEEII